MYYEVDIVKSPIRRTGSQRNITKIVCLFVMSFISCTCLRRKGHSEKFMHKQYLSLNLKNQNTVYYDALTLELSAHNNRDIILKNDDDEVLNLNPVEHQN